MADMLSEEEFLKTNTGAEFRYMLLDRLRSDCDYYLAVELPNGCPQELNHLWAHHDPVAQIAYMKYLWNALEEKPEWLSMEDILDFEKRIA